MVEGENFHFLGEGEGVRGGGDTSHSSRGCSKGGGGSGGRRYGESGDRGGGPSIRDMYSSIPAATSTVRIALLISLSGLHISVTVYSTILS